ncbi:MAG: hypothetical protein D6766_11565 [Verrucomicrobia bacterium]|nr:MAG: hypothetical protein D6766_11565 [Verrucomicrobiota bacterium]
MERWPHCQIVVVLSARALAGRSFQLNSEGVEINLERWPQVCKVFRVADGVGFVCAAHEATQVYLDDRPILLAQQ